MAKGNPGAEDRAKVKLRVIEFELEGSNASVENSIRQLTNALSVRNGTMKPAIPAKPQKELGVATETEDIVEADVVDPDESGGEAPLAATPAKPARVKPKPKAPEYINELNLTGNGTTFKEFAKEKAPTNRSKQYLVAAYWLKVHGDSPTVNVDKMYTCFKMAPWPTPFND